MKQTKKILCSIGGYVALIGAAINGIGALMMFMVGISLIFQPNLFRFLNDQGFLDTAINQQMIESLLNVNHFWMIAIYIGLCMVMIFKVISYYLGYCILKSWKKEQWNTQDLIRRTAYCIFETQIISFLLGIIISIVSGISLLDGGLIEFDWILAGLFLLCLPQFRTHHIEL